VIWTNSKVFLLLIETPWQSGISSDNKPRENSFPENFDVGVDNQLFQSFKLSAPIGMRDGPRARPPGWTGMTVRLLRAFCRGQPAFGQRGGGGAVVLPSARHLGGRNGAGSIESPLDRVWHLPLKTVAAHAVGTGGEGDRRLLRTMSL